jgi:hypothetical protein
MMVYIAHLKNKHEDGHMQNFKHKKYLGNM